MSARKSWDIAPRRAAAKAASPRMARSVEMTRRPATRAAAPARPARARAATPRTERPSRPSSLRDKRKKQRKLGWIVLGVLLLILLAVVVYVLWLPAFRVQTVAAEGPGADGIEAVVLETLRGTQYGVLPRSSIFLVPQDDIRARVLDAYPQVQAVSISATGFTSLSVRTLARDDAFVWCGESPALRAPTCYKADAEGLIFAAHDLPVATSTATSSDDLLVFGPLANAGESPIRAHVTYASALPGALKFIKAMRGLGADIVSVTLRGDEVDLHTEGGTRITYVIGDEGEAAILAATSFPTLNVNDGSIEYVDLRFRNKVYLKRVGEE